MVMRKIAKKRRLGKRKPKGISQLREDAAKNLQKIVRLKAAILREDNGNVKCVTCPKIDHYSKMQGGHWIERKRIPTMLIESNIAVQCPYCNRYGMRYSTHTHVNFYMHMVDTYGIEHCNELLAFSLTKPKEKIEDIVQMKIEFDALLKNLENEVIKKGYRH
jgi:hypothetical protein